MSDLFLNHERETGREFVCVEGRGLRKGEREKKEKMEKEGSIKIYESKNSFFTEKSLVKSTFVFSFIFSSAIFFTDINKILKVINLIFLAPCISVQLDYFFNRSIFIKIIRLLPNNKISIIDMWGRELIFNIEDLCKSVDDQRFSKINESMNHEQFIIITHKKKSSVYYIPRDGIFLNEDLFHNIIEGKLI